MKQMISVDNLSEFKQSYDNAINEGEDMFTFEGADVLTSYAKYVIQYFNLIKPD
tara:strand:+ start:1447 stop:1608 length:162 start_codon:yes stop_codon:yes gene_type:complete